MAPAPARHEPIWIGQGAEARGHVASDDLRAMLAGYDDSQIIEIAQHVALNTWTNYINEVALTEIDFPVVNVSEVA